MNRREFLASAAAVPLAALAVPAFGGPVDDAPTLNARLAALKPGETLSLRGGTYHLESPICLSVDHTTLEGGLFFTNNPNGFLVLEGGDHTTIQDCHFITGDKSRYGVTVNVKCDAPFPTESERAIYVRPSQLRNRVVGNTVYKS